MDTLNRFFNKYVFNRYLEYEDWCKVQSWLKAALVLTATAALIAIAAAVVVAVGWVASYAIALLINRQAALFNVGFGIACLASALVGGWVYHSLHDCERRRTPSCSSCEAADARVQKFRNEADAALANAQRHQSSYQEYNQLLRGLVFSSQEYLDDLLRIWAERVEEACRRQAVLQSVSKPSPKEQLVLAQLRHQIQRYHGTFNLVERRADRFGLVVASGWSAYFPEKSEGAKVA